MNSITEFAGLLQDELRKYHPSAKVSYDSFFGGTEEIRVTILDYTQELKIGDIRKLASYVKTKDLVKSVAESINEDMRIRLKNEEPEVSFGKAIEGAFDGHMIARKLWADGTFVFAQVPSEINFSIVPKMTSLPPKVKEEFTKRGKNLFYSNQFAIVYPDNKIHGWSPSPSDCLANDWFIRQ